MIRGHANFLTLALAGAALARQPDTQPPNPASDNSTPPDSLTTPSTTDAATLDDADRPTLDTVERPWTIRLEPAYWYAAPRGEIKLPSSVGPVEFAGDTFEGTDESDLSELDADDPGSGFLGRAHFARDRWRLSIGLTTLGTSGDGTADAPGRLGDAFFAQGDSLHTTFDITTFDASLSYLVLHGPDADDPRDPHRFRYTLEVLAGARLEYLDIDVQVDSAGPRPPELGTRSSAAELFGQPIAGTRLSLDLFDDFTIEVGLTLGYWSLASGSTASTWDILAAFTWRPIQNVGIQVGYQYLGLTASRDVDQGEFEFAGSSAGLFGGLAFQF